jgi:hypothetical protein
VFDRLLTLNHEAFAAGRYNAAYHALAAALHVAHALQDTEGLARVERLVGEQLVWIDDMAPEYEHSTPSAATRGHHSIFTLLAHQAQAMRLRLPDEHGSA